MVVDLFPGKLALGGLYTGLKSAGTFHNLAVACDMPFLNRDLLYYLISLAPGFDAVVPRINDMVEPLHAVYSKSCLSTVERLLDEDRLSVLEIFNLVNTRYVEEDEIAKFDPDRRSFFNINTPNDLREAERLAKLEA